MQPTLSRHSNTVRDSFPRRRNSDLGFYSVFQIALDLWKAVLYRDFCDPPPQLKRASWKMPNFLSNEKFRKGSYTYLGLDSMHWINTVIYYRFFNSELLFKSQCLSCSSYWNGEKKINSFGLMDRQQINSSKWFWFFIFVPRERTNEK